MYGPPSALIAFAEAHPGLNIEVPPPLHLLLDVAGPTVGSRTVESQGLDGTGTLVGIADTGIDLTHPDFLDEFGHTRVAWLLDLASAPLGIHADLETKFGTPSGAGTSAVGAVWSAADIDAQLEDGSPSNLPGDDIGHGTLVASCAAGGGLTYRGVAPRAGLLIARIVGADGSIVAGDDMLRAVAFLYDRAQFLNQPVVVNLSIGTDFGPHDGTMDWEQSLAAFVGAGYPGRAIVAAAGNSGSVSYTPIHQQVHVDRTAPQRVPLQISSAQNGGVEVWVSLHPGADMSVGLDSPDGTWIAPVADGASDSAGTSTSPNGAAIYNGSQAPGGSVPAASSGAEVIWQGSWQGGTYWVTLVGSGTADLYVAFTGDADDYGSGTDGFLGAVHDGTINLPATNPTILSVGCTINKDSWTSAGGPSGLLGSVPPPYTGAAGEPCWFSSAGPTLTGIAKPEIMAPGAAIVGAMSSRAPPSSPSSIFYGPASCPIANPTCLEADATHAVALGTSFSSPLVAGAAAILFEFDPSLTQSLVVAALQGGAHRLRGAAPFDDQAGPGELDIPGALAVLDQRTSAEVSLPSRAESWLTLGADPCLADGSTPFEADLELRASPMTSASPLPAGGFDPSRLAPEVRVDGVQYEGVATLASAAPGSWLMTVRLPAGLGERTLTLGATFDGADIVDPKSVPIAVDPTIEWTVPTASGGCAVASPVGTRGMGVMAGASIGVALALLVLRARPRPAAHSPSGRQPLDCEHPAVWLPLALRRRELVLSASHVRTDDNDAIDAVERIQCERRLRGKVGRRDTNRGEDGSA
jgi:hypothetical protein